MLSTLRVHCGGRSGRSFAPAEAGSRPGSPALYWSGCDWTGDQTVTVIAKIFVWCVERRAVRTACWLLSLVFQKEGRRPPRRQDHLPIGDAKFNSASWSISNQQRKLSRFCVFQFWKSKMLNWNNNRIPSYKNYHYETVKLITVASALRVQHFKDKPNTDTKICAVTHSYQYLSSVWSQLCWSGPLVNEQVL